MNLLHIWASGQQTWAFSCSLTVTLSSGWPDQSLCFRLHLSLELKISSSSGCVLHAAGRQRGRAVVALSISDGFLLLSVDAGRTKVSLRSNKKYQDERWHTVSSQACATTLKRLIITRHHEAKGLKASVCVCTVTTTLALKTSSQLS